MFNFVIDSTDAAHADIPNIGPEDYVRVFTRGDYNWCLQAYLILAKRNRLPVCCTNRLLSDKINIIHSDQLLKLQGTPSEFVVCVRADYPQRRWAHYHLVQNMNQLGSNCTFIPHWVQPGLIKRDEHRQGVKRVAYAGAPIRGNMAGSTESWRSMFEQHGLEFVVQSSGNWHDLSTVDVLVGIRSFSTHPYNTKPPTKLFSAWHANIPFVGGYDSAFRQLGVPEEDYLLAGTPEDVVKQVLRLRDHPALYAKLVYNGQQKACMYTEQTIADIWEATLTGTVMHRYTQWKNHPVYEQVRFNILQEVGLLEHTTKQMVKRLLKGSNVVPMLKKALS
ncbi:hypothetical protein D770_19825 [Flammeovirgaceae bacterium 311]|nr:hypothetical protein D770_19825 [Flammeovirgaceae bacterium 311]